MIATLVSCLIFVAIFGVFITCCCLDAEDAKLRLYVFGGLSAGYDDHIETLGDMTDEDVANDMVAYDDDVNNLVWTSDKRFAKLVELVHEWRVQNGRLGPLPETIGKYR